MPVEDQIAILYCGTQGLLKGVPLDKVHDFEKEFLHELHTSHQHDVLDILKPELSTTISGRNWKKQQNN